MALGRKLAHLSPLRLEYKQWQPEAFSVARAELRVFRTIERMQRWEGLAGLQGLPAGAVISIGNFDGVHTGHQAILRAMTGDDRPTAVVTFEPHPLTVLRPDLVPPRLTPLAMKERLLGEFGVNHLVLLPPTKQVLGLTAVEFWEILRDRVRPSRIVEGQSFNFGRDRSGTIEKLIEWSAGTGIRVEQRPAHAVHIGEADIVVSSSVIRTLLLEGRVEEATGCLGRPFQMEGEVVQGFQRGRTIGVPTANLKIDDQMVPAEGVYVGQVTINGKRFAAAISIGNMPTFDGKVRQIEVHVIDFSGDLYGQRLAVSFIQRLRGQTKFASVDALKTQMVKDILTAKQIGLAEPALG